MQGIRLLALCGLIIGTSYLTASLDTSFAFDKPIHTAIVVLFFCGAGIIGAERILKRRGSNRVSRRDHYQSVPLEDGPHHSPRHSSPVSQNRPGIRAFSAPRACLALLLVVAICVCIALLQRILKDVQCAKQSYQAFLPLVLALNDIWFSQRRQESYGDGHKGTIYKLLTRHIFHSRLRYLLPTIMLGWSSASSASIGSFPRSTYICSQSSEASLVPTLQNASFLLDAIIVLTLYHLLERSQDEPLHDERKIHFIGAACIISSLILFIAGIILYFALPEYRAWILVTSASYLKDVLALAVAVASLLLVCLYNIHTLGIISTAVIIVYTSTYVASFQTSLITISHPFPPIPDGKVIWCILFLCIAMLFYLVAESASGSKLGSSAQPGLLKLPSRVVSLFVILLLGRVALLFWHQSNAGFHPIDLLMYNADLEHRKWVKQAHSSGSLGNAIEVYQKRYHRHPPPRFDIWHEYAVNSSSAVIDDFDNIEDDLAPFWSLPPSEIRDRTRTILNDQRNDLGGISIRNGKGEIFSNVPGTHRWMLDGTIQMIEKFGEWLPDMDIAINLNDECRVAVPFQDMRTMVKPEQSGTKNARRQTSDKSATGGSVSGDFSYNRASTWKPISEGITTDTGFISASFQPTFYDFGSINCPPSSRARTQRHWNTRSFCVACIRPHSVGPFVSNWSLSASPCHQPDLANLHGLHLSPSSFTGTHNLVPIFSQSKASGYADIRYPSPWNYVDKTVYAPTNELPDPPFAEKNNTLFWRGATSEGFSVGGEAWKGMLRQRLVHLINNATDQAPVLLPSGGGRLHYKLVKPPHLKSLVTNTDVRFVDPITRCGGKDCFAQAQEFGFGNPVDFQQHWRYKYLFDADGAGFSGRFIPFLLSNSLVLKTALFREWYEGRLQPWLHFVPIDIRLHDLWSVLVYFAGLEGRVGGKEVKVEGKEKEASLIVEQGKEWTGRVLRKEDMEIYFFRLLLEWGRLTDDRRDQIGFGI